MKKERKKNYTKRNLFGNVYHYQCCEWRNWEQELTKARKRNQKPRLRNAILRTFWKSCIVDGFLVLIFTLLKSIMPVFLAQLLVQFQLPAKIDNTTIADNFDASKLPSITSDEITTKQTIMTISNDDDANIFEGIFRYMMFVW
ncbi:CLUMA_CG012756, isoform A [Clunio marinus]|uniref:CLUMA_CG012756, isoform A n=1 Tax=Clunio marinus TaxID=568069 RepID=A0A1J1IGD0_9DIPT|nr:CLUMA_CG012756, isoform A [Clunio marinus]